MFIIEMVAYSTVRFGGPPWRCVICPDQDNYTEEEIYKHLVELHNLEKADLKLERGEEIFKYPSKEMKVSN